MLRRFFSYYRLAVFLLFVALCSSVSMAAEKSAIPADSKIFSGKIIETMNAAGYTYLLVASETGKTWVAIPETEVKMGNQVNYYAGMTMPNFTSKTLNRTFENIVFSPGLVENENSAKKNESTKAPAQDDSFAAALQAEQKSIATSAPSDQSSAGSAGAIAPLQEISVPKAEGENSYTVEEIFGKSKTLNGKRVRVRGKVVKVSLGIMGKNWVHLQDGTGDPLQNTHDLVLTTDTSPAVDAILTMEGILAADKDFGAGYKYAAIVEQSLPAK